MQAKILTAIFLFAAFGATQDVDVDDFPRACQQACQDISSLSDDCDNRTDDDTAERDCVCNADNALQLATSCAACVKANIQNDDDDDDEEDIRDLFSACGWNYADVSAANSTGSVITTTQTFSASTTTVTSSGVTTTQTFPASTVTTTGSTSPTSTGTQTPDSAGAGVTAGVGIIAAGLMAALPVVL